MLVRRQKFVEGNIVSDTNPRVADHPVDAQFLARWSPRAFTGEKFRNRNCAACSRLRVGRRRPPICSRGNSLFALRGTPEFDTFLGLLNKSNQVWAKTAGALLILASKSTNTPPGSDKPVPSRSHSFDTGAAWAYFALAAQQRGWAAHAMGGFDVERTRPALICRRTSGQRRRSPLAARVIRARCPRASASAKLRACANRRANSLSKGAFPRPNQSHSRRVSCQQN